MSNIPNLSDRLLQTTNVLRGLPLVNLGLGLFNARGQRVNSSCYILPLKNHHTQMYGLFMKDKKLSEAPIGFIQELEDGSYKAYKPRPDGNIAPWTQDSSSVYLPLKLTHLQLDSPSYIMGVDGSRGVFPLLYFQDSEAGIRCNLLLKNIEGKVSNIEQTPSIDVQRYLRDTLTKMTTGEIYELQEKPLAKAQAKKKNEQSKIEVISNGVDWREPQSIIKGLHDYVIGQEKAKDKVSVGFSNYMLKALNPQEELEKSNIIFFGGTGSGKTLMAETLLELSGLPYITIDLSTKTAEGYKGSNMNEDFVRFRQKTEGEAPHGVIFVDEGEKNEERSFNTSLHNQLIPWVQGSTVTFDDHKNKGLEPLNTKNILFIIAGAFAKNGEGKSLEEIITGQTQRVIGFNSNLNEPQRTIHDITPTDLKEYGWKPELIGRFPIRAGFENLTQEQLVQILTQSKKSILKTYYKLCELRGLNVELDSDIPELMAQACPPGTGARELKAICQQLFEPIFLRPGRFVNHKNLIYISTELAQEILHVQKQKEEEFLIP